MVMLFVAVLVMPETSGLQDFFLIYIYIGNYMLGNNGFWQWKCTLGLLLYRTEILLSQWVQPLVNSVFIFNIQDFGVFCHELARRSSVFYEFCFVVWLQIVEGVGYCFRMI
jgi:hypothetical protein